MPNNGCQKMDAKKWMPTNGCQKMDAKKWMPTNGCVDVNKTTLTKKSRRRGLGPS